MKLPVNIDDLLTARTVEGERLEFKAGWNSKAAPNSRSELPTGGG